MDTNVGLSLLTFRDLFEEPFYYPEKYSIFLSIIILEREQQTALKIWPSERLFQHFLVFTSISHHCSQVPPAKPFLQRNKTSAFQQRSECTNLRVQGIFEDIIFFQ